MPVRMAALAVLALLLACQRQAAAPDEKPSPAPAAVPPAPAAAAPRTTTAPDLARTRMAGLPGDRLLFYRNGWARIRHPDATWGPELAFPGYVFRVSVGPAGFLVEPGFDRPPDAAQSSATLFDLEGAERARWIVPHRGLDVAWSVDEPLLLTEHGALPLRAGGRVGELRPYTPGIPLPVGGAALPHLFTRHGVEVTCLGNNFAKEYSVMSHCERTGAGAYRFDELFYHALGCGDWIVLLGRDEAELVVREHATGVERKRLRLERERVTTAACSGEQQLAVATTRQLQLLGLPALEPVSRVALPAGREVQDMAVLSSHVAYRLAGSPNELLLTPRVPP